jgi:thiosulfate reductase/polysulfide reductase chain A
LGLSLDELKAKGYLEAEEEAKSAEIVFNTPSGKIEVYSETLANAGFSPWPSWEEPPYPTENEFYLLTGKVGQHTQFATQNNQYLHKYQDEPGLWMNPDAAEKLGLADHDLVEVSSEIGKVNIILKVTQAIRPDCVYMTPGFGHLSKGWTTGYGVGASESMLHMTYTDPISGSQALSQTFVTVKKISGSQPITLPKPLHAGE